MPAVMHMAPFARLPRLPGFVNWSSHMATWIWDTTITIVHMREKPSLQA
jgi:hypothetical protein